MNSEKFKIAFMDDEIFNDGEPIPNMAFKSLKKDGYDVTPFNKMSDLLEVFKQQFFDLYILDIDMSQMDDKLNDEDKNGISVGEILKMLSSLSNIVVFSARGVVDDMINAANYHFYKYIHKSSGIEVLKNTIVEIEKKQDYSAIDFFVNEIEENRALLYYRKNDYISEKDIQAELDKHFDFIDTSYKLDQAIALKNENQYSTILLVSDEFPNRKSITEQLIALNDGDENLIFVLYSEATDTDEKYIIPLVNLNPFRILNLRWDDKIKKLNEFIKKAILWYGRNEIFEFPPQNDICYNIIKNSKLSEAQKQEIIYMQEELQESDSDLMNDEVNND